MSKMHSESRSSYFFFPSKSTGTLWTLRVPVRPVPETGKEGATAAGADLGRVLAPYPQWEPEL